MGSIVKDQSGDTIGFVGAIRDLSIQKHQAEELKTLSKRLELLVQIIASDYENIDAQINKAIKLTAQLLDFEVGIVSNISGNDYKIEYYYPAESTITSPPSTKPF